MPILNELTSPSEAPPQVFRSPKEARAAYPVIERVEDVFSEQLTDNVRFDFFRMDESVEEWVQLLGPDVLFLTHPHESARLTHDFVTTHDAYSQPIGNKLRNDLYTAPWIHDMGELKIEGEGVGDIAFDKKTEDDEHKEMKIFESVITALAQPQDAADLLNVYHSIAMDKQSPLGQRFNAIERVGYTETAMRSYLGYRGQRIENWQGLSGNVLRNQIPALLDMAKTYPYVDIFLSENKTVLSAMFRDIAGKDVPFNKNGEAAYEPSQLINAKNAWESSAYS